MSAVKAGLPCTSLTASTFGSGRPTVAQLRVSVETRICGMIPVRVNTSGTPPEAGGAPPRPRAAPGAPWRRPRLNKGRLQRVEPGCQAPPLLGMLADRLDRRHFFAVGLCRQKDA